MPQASERLFATPMTRPRLPCITPLDPPIICLLSIAASRRACAAGR
jgi:hypothetical protein